MMNYLPYIIIAILAVIAVAALIYAFITRKNLSQTMTRIDSMLDKAKEGEFKANSFTEEEVSALECKFADFLNSSLTNEVALSEEKNRIKEMISDISHQTKTPIANLLLYSELLGEEESLSSSGKESVEVIHGQTEKLRFLVDSLVKLSRLENGVVAVNSADNSVNELVQGVVAELGNKAKAKGLELVGPSNQEEIRAKFDMKWTREAIINIVDNAIKYTNEGLVDVRISATDVFARVDIKDTGIGISEEDSAKVFQRFYRSREVAGEEGVGIGLYLAREIITNEGGYIKLASVKGEGTTFSVFIPVK